MTSDPTAPARTTYVDLVKQFGQAVKAGEMTEADAIDALLATDVSITREGTVQALKHWETFGSPIR